jgi:hypothetical protein
MLAELDDGIAATNMKESCVLLLLRNRKRFLSPLRILENDRLVDTENNEGAGSAAPCIAEKPAIFCTARLSYPENDRLLRAFGLFLACDGVESPKEDLDVKPVEIVPWESDEVVRAWRVVAVRALSRMEL